MPYAVQQPGTWYTFGRARVFRFVPTGSTYAPNTAYETGGGRFDNGTRATLYVSLSPEGAVAEYFRARPELLQFQDTAKIRLYEFEFVTHHEGLDVQTEKQSIEIGFPFDRLTSSERNEIRRYAECRQLADIVESQLGVSIACPSAAYGPTSNVVLFEHASSSGWEASDYAEIDPPILTESDIHTIH